MFRILIVEDDKNISSIISEELSQWGYETRGIDNFNDVYDDFKGLLSEADLEYIEILESMNIIIEMIVKQ